MSSRSPVTSLRHAMFRPLAYVWAFFPGTLIGLLCLPAALLGGGRCRCERGCLEIHGGGVTWFLKNGLPWVGVGLGAAALTLGHVILGQNEYCLERSRDHEHVHVRQYERWGPLFLPAYFVASLWMWWRGWQAYLDNPFEREAFETIDRMIAERALAADVDRHGDNPHGDDQPAA